MANHNIERIIADVEQADNYGETTSDDVVRREIVEEIVFKQSDLIAVGTDIIPQRTFNNLDVDFSYPKEIDGQYPVSENSIVERERVQWGDFELELEQAEARFMITDIARVRGQGQLQNEMSTRRAAEAIAKLKDDNILDTLLDGAPSATTKTLTRGNDEGWDQSNGDPEQDVMDTWNNIFENSNVNENDIENTFLVAPSKVFAELNSLQLINNVQQRLRDYLGDTYGINLRFSRLLDDDNDALLVVGGEQTAIHGVLDHPAIDNVEQERVFGRGQDTLVKQFFGTAIVEDDGLTDESYRIGKIENVSA